jgi:hypothetical protein
VTGVARHEEPMSLADVLERVLDKGLVIAGDIRVNLLDIELLTIKIRLLVASVDKAREMGIDWWEHDPTLSIGERNLVEENRALRERIARLEAGAAHGIDGASDGAAPVQDAGVLEQDGASRAVDGAAGSSARRRGSQRPGKGEPT